jgi:hypothetical protein
MTWDYHVKMLMIFIHLCILYAKSTLTIVTLTNLHKDPCYIIFSIYNLYIFKETFFLAFCSLASTICILLEWETKFHTHALQKVKI